jgi:hypothetical protein
MFGLESEISPTGDGPNGWPMSLQTRREKQCVVYEANARRVTLDPESIEFLFINEIMSTLFRKCVSGGSTLRRRFCFVASACVWVRITSTLFDTRTRAEGAVAQTPNAEMEHVAAGF